MKKTVILVASAILLILIPLCAAKESTGDLTRNAAKWLLDPRSGAGDKALEGMKKYTLERVSNSSDRDSGRIVSVTSRTPVHHSKSSNQQVAKYELVDSSAVLDDLPFKNNHDRNLLYSSQLYDAGEREEALDTYYNMIAAYRNSGKWGISLTPVHTSGSIGDYGRLPTNIAGIGKAVFIRRSLSEIFGKSSMATRLYLPTMPSS